VALYLSPYVVNRYDLLVGPTAEFGLGRRMPFLVCDKIVIYA
jgi:hypothetical protein